MADICTIAEVKLALRIGDTNDDAWLTSAITDLTDWMEQYTGRYLTDHGTATVLFDTAAGSVIDCPLGIRSVTTLLTATTDQPDSGGVYPTTVPAASIVLRPPAQSREPGLPASQIAILGTVAQLRNTINGASVAGSWGPSTTPRRFARIGIEAVAAAYQSRRFGGSGVIGGDDSPVVDWSRFFAWGSPQRQTLLRARAGSGIA